MPDFRHRSRDRELMDGPDVAMADFAACMADLARVNTLTLARRPTLAFVDRALRLTPCNRPLAILDVGFGGGDMLRVIAEFLARRGRPARLIGIDINPRGAAAARAMTPPSVAIEYRTGDAAAWRHDEPVDLVISSLVAHHMEDGEIRDFLRWMEATARRGWLVNDLHRHWCAWHGFRLLAAAMRWHPFVRHDGPLSIARAFRRQDWETLLEQADLAGDARIAWWFPFRYCIERMK